MLTQPPAQIGSSSTFHVVKFDSATTLIMAPLHTLSHFMDTCTITAALMHGSRYFGGTVHASYSDMMEEQFIVELIAE